MTLPIADHLICMACGAHIEHGHMERHYASLHRDVKKLVAESEMDEVVVTFDEFPDAPTARRAWTDPITRVRHDVHRFFQPAICSHTPEEIREMAHKLHVAEQAQLIKDAVENDPAFFGVDAPVPFKAGGHPHRECKARGCL